MMRFVTEKKDMARRLGTVLAAVLMWLSVCVIPVFGYSTECGSGVCSHAAFCEDSAPSAAAKNLTASLPQTSVPSRQEIRNFSRPQIPAASDETRGSRVYATGNQRTVQEKAPGPRLSVFMENARLPHLFSIHTSAVFFSDKEAETCNLTIIQYLHAQDGLKG